MMEMKKERYFNVLVKELNFESHQGEDCETCPILERCLEWWDLTVCSGYYPMKRKQYEKCKLEIIELTKRS
jgi:hypothetical protein